MFRKRLRLVLLASLPGLLLAAHAPQVALAQPPMVQEKPGGERIKGLILLFALDSLKRRHVPAGAGDDAAGRHDEPGPRERLIGLARIERPASGGGDPRRISGDIAL